MFPVIDALQLVDYRQRVAGLYERFRAAGAGEPAWRAWREERDELLRSHPQTPVPARLRDGFGGMGFFPHDPAWRLEVEVGPADGPVVDGWRPVGTVVVAGTALTLFGLATYGGGVWLPFRDATSGDETYGGGRYVLDTVKGADHGTTPEGRLVLDFNAAYSPSCAHDPYWSCPLAPPGNTLPGPVRAGELTPASG